MTPFDYQGRTLRHIEIAGEPWFSAGDVCQILGIYQRSAMAQKVRTRLDASEAQTHRFLAPHPRWSGKTIAREILVISESGLYKLIMRSDKETARPFQNWVTQVVPPSIRKTGGYQMAPGETMPVPEGMAADCHPLLS